MATRLKKTLKKMSMTPQQLHEKAFVEAIKLIRVKEPEMAKAIEDTAIHIGQTYSDKYANSPIETKGLIYWHDDKAKGYNMGQAARYIQRYLTDGFRKSDNPTDLKKGLHYMLFELTRLIKRGKIENKTKDIVE